jgi:hypothetical protein
MIERAMEQGSLMVTDNDKNSFPDSLSVPPVVLYEFKKPADIIERSGPRSRRDYYFSAIRMHTPDQ